MLEPGNQQAKSTKYLKTIRLAKFRDCFENPKHQGQFQFTESIFAHFHAGLHHPRVAYALINALLFAFAFFSREALIIALTMLLGRALIFFYLQHVARHLNIKLKKSSTSVALGEYARINLEVCNLSIFKIHIWDLCLDFRGSLERIIWLKSHESLERWRNRSISLLIKCDADMGIYEMGPVSIFISDLFGIYTFEILTTIPGKIEIRPKISPIPMIKTKGYLHSDMYGTCELQARGISVNFAGVRPFSLGDSIRHIAWRKTAKFGTLIVREFEKVTNSDVTLIVNLDPAHHIGTPELSTWKTMLDLCLGLASQLLEEGHSLKFGYNSGFIEKSYGPDQFTRILKELLTFDILKQTKPSDFSPQQPESKTFCVDPLLAWEPYITPGGTLMILNVLNFDYLRNILPRLKVFIEEKLEVFLFIINPSEYLSLFSLLSRNFQYSESKSSRTKGLLSEIQALGVQVYTINFGETLAAGLKEHRQGEAE
jgi:uncharacterized protein (DUF58 family)